jgi:acetyl-CoA acetyltransferase family protein
VTADVGPREEQSLETLARLRPVFDRRRGTVTAGNSSPITDGAAALVLVAPGKLTTALPDGGPLGRIRSWATAALPPRLMGLGPVHSTAKLLAREELALADIDLVEINEAFAAQVLACQKAFASNRYFEEEFGLPAAPGAVEEGRLNVNGGAVALGHPVGASGARLILTLLREMRRRGLRRGLAALCVGGGQGMSVLVEAR